jgi:hypothetical protein
MLFFEFYICFPAEHPYPFFLNVFFVIDRRVYEIDTQKNGIFTQTLYIFLKQYIITQKKLKRLTECFSHRFSKLTHKKIKKD